MNQNRKEPSKFEGKMKMSRIHAGEKPYENCLSKLEISQYYYQDLIELQNAPLTYSLCLKQKLRTLSDSFTLV